MYASDSRQQTNQILVQAATTSELVPVNDSLGDGESMSILLKGIEMPKCCYDCLLCAFIDIDEGDLTVGCRALRQIVYDHSQKLLDCPMVELPPHGRLIDADALINALQELFDRRNKNAEYTGFRGASVSWNDAICYLKDAPTIIPAESKEKTCTKN